jgi:hypothetical protein
MPIFSGVGSPGTVASASGGKVTPVNGLTTTPGQVIGINSQRRQITFHNPGGSITVYVYMLQTATGATLVPALPNSLGGTFSVLPGGFLVVDGECQFAWGAFAASGSTASLTIMESNT